MADSASHHRRSVHAPRIASGKLTRGMTCATAMQTIAQGCLEDLNRVGRSAADGNVDALHRMRIALTRLRTAIRFFAPAVDGGDWTTLQEQAAWLSRQAGRARDLDVALRHRKGAERRTAKRWRGQRHEQYEHLRTALHSVRFRRFIAGLTQASSRLDRSRRVIDENGPSIEAFSVSRLERWQRKLLRKGRKLEQLSASNRHRLRMRAKRLKYALEWSLPVVGKARKVLRKQIRHARLVQNVLGKLNDATTHQAQAKALGIAPLPSMVRIGRQRSRRQLLEKASAALKRLGRLKVPA